MTCMIDRTGGIWNIEALVGFKGIPAAFARLEPIRVTELH